MLDRGETKDWFGSTEIIIEAIMARPGLYLFLVHMLTGEAAIHHAGDLQGPQLVFGLVVMFAVGMVLLASSALLAPWLQELGNYPVDAAGLLLAPRGVGTMLAMMVAGRIDQQDRSALHDGSRRLPAGVEPVAAVHLDAGGARDGAGRSTRSIQGAGIGLVFVPLNVVAFGTLAPRCAMRAPRC